MRWMDSRKFPSANSPAWSLRCIHHGEGTDGCAFLTVSRQPLKSSRCGCRKPWMVSTVSATLPTTSLFMVLVTRPPKQKLTMIATCERCLAERKNETWSWTPPRFSLNSFSWNSWGTTSRRMVFHPILPKSMLSFNFHNPPTSQLYSAFSAWPTISMPFAQIYRRWSIRFSSSLEKTLIFSGLLSTRQPLRPPESWLRMRRALPSSTSTSQSPFRLTHLTTDWAVLLCKQTRLGNFNRLLTCRVSWNPTKSSGPKLKKKLSPSVLHAQNGISGCMERRSLSTQIIRRWKPSSKSLLRKPRNVCSVSCSGCSATRSTSSIAKEPLWC